MRKKIFILLVFAAILNMSMISAEIMLSQPKSIYNMGDMLDISATIKANTNIDGSVSLTLICGNLQYEFYREPLSLTSGEQKKIDKKLLLTDNFINGMRGDCRIKAKYGDESQETQTFQITSRIDLSLNFNTLNAKPGDKIAVKGNAIKANSELVEGFLEIEIENTDIKLTRTISKGNFQFNFSFPENIKSGNYRINVKAYEKSGQGITNEGTESNIINLRQEPSKIDIVIDKQSAKPEETIKFKPLIYDRAGENIQGDVKVKVMDGFEEVYYNKLVKTGEEIEFGLDNNASSGYWKIEASALGIEAKRLFYVEEVEKAKFEIINDTLIITNIGNAPYRKAVQIAIGDEVDIKEMDLEVGESKRFRLTAPDGNYKVSVTDGKESLVLNGVGLTGNVIGVLDIKQQLSMINKYPIVWLFLIIVFGLFVFMMFERVVKKKSYGYAVSTSKKPVMNIGDKEAEHSLVMHGNKENASVLVIKMKNSVGKESIEQATENIRKNKGSLYKSGDDIIGIFAPSLTKSFNNELIAVKVAGAIASHFNEHNRRFKDKIDFGIGVHSGELVTRMENEKLKFSTLGNTFNLAKKIAEKAKNDVLLSNEANSRVMNEVKTDKQGEYYSIKKIVDREQHKAFIDSFLKRN
ncbi:hypothetical protein FJZ19_04630 [Candidatus Pacearchaeota archaeon]|nr:hypothetical protein [Candidatus Pacearchaeota archaeon]